MLQRTIGMFLLVIGAGLVGYSLGIQVPTEWTLEAITNQKTALPVLNDISREIALVLGGIITFLALIQLFHPNPVA